MAHLSSMRKILVLILISTLLVSCASTRTTRVGALLESSEVVLEVSSAKFLSHGYIVGDWVGVETDNVLIRARVSTERSSEYPTLIVSGEKVILHLPATSAVLGPYKKNVSGSVHVGGTFVFTL